MSGARLFVLGGREAGRTFELVPGTSEDRIVGRDADCALRLRDGSISRRHARVVERDGGWEVEDLGSRNGLLHDGARVERLRLADGDEFLLGEVPLRYRSVEALEREPADVPVVESAASAPPTSPAPARRAPVAVEGEIEIEEEVELTREPAAPERPTRPERPPRTSWLRADLDEQPFWLRAVLAVALLVLTTLLAALAYLGVRWLRGGGG